jgi:hypothetical protein
MTYSAETIDASLRYIFRLPSTSIDELYRLPSNGGIYFAIDGLNQIQYIGQSCNIKERWSGHHRMPELKTMAGVRVACYHYPHSDQVRRDLERSFIDRINPPLNNAPLPEKDFSVKIRSFGGTDLILPERVKEVIIKGNGTDSELTLLKTINGTENNDIYSRKGIEFLGERVDRSSLDFLHQMCRADKSVPNFFDFLDCCKSFIRGSILLMGRRIPLNWYDLPRSKRRCGLGG